MASAASVQHTHVEIAPDVLMPRVGLGTFMMDGSECRNAVAEALRVGLRLIDTANMYENYDAIRAALADSGVNRSQVFITSKIGPWEHGFDAATEAIDSCLSQLGAHSCCKCMRCRSPSA